MAKDPLDVVGGLLIASVRDKSIEDWEQILDGRMKGLTAEKMRQVLARDGTEVPDVVRRVVPLVVDTVLHNLLWMLEQEQSINVSVEADGAVTPSIRDVSDGLCGDLYGWIERFSKKDRTDL